MNASHWEYVTARETLAMHLYTMYRVEQAEAAIAKVSAHISIGNANWADPDKTMWEGMSPVERSMWRSRASNLLAEALK